VEKDGQKERSHFTLDERRLIVRLRWNLGWLEITDWSSAGILLDFDYRAQRIAH